GGQRPRPRSCCGVERLHEEFKRRIKTQTVLPSADTAAMLFWRCMLPARSTCARSMVGEVWPQSPSISQLTSQLDPIPSVTRKLRHANFHTTSRPAPCYARRLRVEVTICARRPP